MLPISQASTNSTAACLAAAAAPSRHSEALSQRRGRAAPLLLRVGGGPCACVATVRARGAAGGAPGAEGQPAGWLLAPERLRAEVSLGRRRGLPRPAILRPRPRAADGRGAAEVPRLWGRVTQSLLQTCGLEGNEGGTASVG